MRMLLATAAVLVAAATTWSAVTWSATTAAIKIDNFKFSPATLTVAKGTEVTWTNQDDIPHSIVLTDGAARSKPMDTDGSFTFKFDKAGNFAYVCGLHPFMKGQIVVK